MGGTAEEFKEMMSALIQTFRYPVSAIRSRFEFAKKGGEVYSNA
jgi:hypothetical protein